MTTSLSRLADEADIIALRIGLGDALDRRDWSRMDRFFLPVIETDFSAFGAPVGPMSREAVIGMFRHAFRHDHVRTFQAYSNFQVRVTGDRAEMVSLLHGYHAGNGFEGGRTFELRARYRDSLVREDEGWRIAATAIDVIGMDGNPALIA
ncbi:MAG: hypothetical protein CTY25_04135 [Methylobacterium sp.]|nr:MAG: hypothetical protein CTY25_04135 [Methylobacterium sp.]